jgi:predicted RNA-binding protein with PUA-like domain
MQNGVMAYWLMKSEPEELPMAFLAAEPTRLFRWDGVHNFRARNWMRAMVPGDQFFFAHSSCKIPGIAGIAEIVGEEYTDPTQFDPEHHYYDPKSKPEKPYWISRDVRYVEEFATYLSLQQLREHTEQLGHFHLLQKANRLSVMPVSDFQWNYICTFARTAQPIT